MRLKRVGPQSLPAYLSQYDDGVDVAVRGVQEFNIEEVANFWGILPLNLPRLTTYTTQL